MEKLTDDLYAEALSVIEEVEELGGMTEAINSGMAKLRIEESATKKQARIDTQEDVVVGVNKYRLEVSRNKGNIYENSINYVTHSVQLIWLVAERGHGRGPKHR